MKPKAAFDPLECGFFAQIGVAIEVLLEHTIFTFSLKMSEVLTLF
jgi:hypothetical protein